VSERLEFVRRWLDGERVVDLCREYGVSRKTAYKIRARYAEFGAARALRLLASPQDAEPPDPTRG
jgi:transposase-like protein